MTTKPPYVIKAIGTLRTQTLAEMRAQFARWKTELTKEQYDAVLQLATRDGWVRGCGLSVVNGKSVVTKFAAQFDATKRDQLMKAYDDMYTMSLNGPDNRAGCDNLRAKIEASARNGRKILLNATPKG